MRSRRSCVAGSRPAVLFELDTGVYGTYLVSTAEVCMRSDGGGVDAADPRRSVAPVADRRLVRKVKAVKATPATYAQKRDGTYA